ncbi:MAG: DUF5692 family protein [Myxococcales bacterium]
MFGMFQVSEGMTAGRAWLVWLAIGFYLFVLNEVTRRFKWVGLIAFTAVPLILSIFWFTTPNESLFSTHWFALAKIYSCTAGCVGFWAIRFIKGTDEKTGKEWRLVDSQWALAFPPAILAINIMEAVMRDFEVGSLYYGALTTVAAYHEIETFLGGPWNYMNGIAGILNIITITGWVGITVRKKTKYDGGQDMLWPDMLWFWVIAYDLWNFAFTYNCLPQISFYVGLALLLAPTICSFTIGKGAWLQHRAHTLAIMVYTVQTFGTFFSSSIWTVKSTNDPRFLFAVSFIALASNVAVFAYMLYKIKVTRRNPYKAELYLDHQEYIEIRSFGVKRYEAEVT